MLLGCAADDLTGATDLAGTLAREGRRVVLLVGSSDRAADVRNHDAVVVALKSRSIPAADAVTRSLLALDGLRRAGAERIYFKYASTFDSTPAGNIGPVTDALADALDAPIVVACPSFPANGRVVRDGILLVNGTPLAESPMRAHPLNPMTESSVVQLLAAQTSRPVGLVDRRVVAAGSAAIRASLDELRREGVRHAVVDAADERDLDAIAGAVALDRLVTGGSALAGAIARVGLAPTRRSAPASREWNLAGTPAAVLAGSASHATRTQIEAFRRSNPILEIDPAEAVADDGLPNRLADTAVALLGDGPVLVAAVPPAGEPSGRVGSAIERTLAAVAQRLVDDGVRRLVVAGGETSGAVVGALGLDRLEVGREIDPGVPVVVAPEAGGRPAIGLVLKSGNFGSDDFFARALAALGGG